MTVYVTKVRGLSPLDGLVGGAIAGVVQTIIATVYSLISGNGFWSFTHLLATIVGRPANVQAGFTTDVLIGLVVNIVILAILGLLFAVMARTLEAKVIVWSALAFGLIAWAIGYFLVLPASGVGLSPELRDGAGALTTASSMLIYGSVLGAYLMRRQKRELVNRY